MTRSFLILVLLTNAGSPLAWGQQPLQTAGRIDLYGDPLPEGARARLGTCRLRQTVLDMDFSPDGNVLATSGTGSALLWDGRTGRPLRRFERRQRVVVNAVALSPAGALLAEGAQDRVLRV
jgi:WD40 repeat protein